MSHTEIPFYKATSVCLTIQQPELKGKYRGTLLVTKGWVNHELTLPREHHHLFMRCQTQWVKTGFSRCAAKQHFSDFFFFFFWCWNVTKEFLSSTSLTLCCPFGLVSLQIRVGGDETDVQLVKLFPNTAYTLSLFALHGELASDPLTKQGVTCMYSLNHEVCLCTASYYCDLIHWPSVPCSVPLPPAGELRVRDVTHSSMVLNWDAAPGAVRKYRVTYKPEDGEVKEVSLVTLRFSSVPT